MLNEIYERYAEDEFLKADGFDDAVIGVEGRSQRLIYSTIKIINILQERDGMSEEEAIEFFEYNIEGAWMGEKTPIFCDDLF